MDDPDSCSCSGRDDTSSTDQPAEVNEIIDAPCVEPPYKLIEVEVDKSVLDLRSCSCSTSSESGAAGDDQRFGPCPQREPPPDEDELADQLAVRAALQCVAPSTDSSCSCTGVSSSSQATCGRATPSSGDSECLKTCTCTEPCESLLRSKSSSELVPGYTPLECTLAIIKPEAMIYKEMIEREILEAGFKILRTRWLKLTAEQASELYNDVKEIGSLEGLAKLVAYMSSGPILALVISKKCAIQEWRCLIGPTKVSDARIYAPDSIRGTYGRKGDDMKNAVHGSANCQAAEREIHFFFPDHILEPVTRGSASTEYLWNELNELLMEGLVKCCEEKPEDPLSWLGNWLLDNNSRAPKYL